MTSFTRTLTARMFGATTAASVAPIASSENRPLSRISPFMIEARATLPSTSVAVV